MKTVQERKYKFFKTHLEAVMGQNYIEYIVDVEGDIPPASIERVDGGGVTIYRLKSIQRVSPEPHTEYFYLKLS